MKNNKKNNRSFLEMLRINMFGGREKMYMLEEELEKGKNENNFSEEDEMQSPFMTTVRTFGANKTAVFGLIMFVIIFLTVLIGPMFSPVDLSFSETSQANTAPGFDLMKFPEELEGNIKNIDVGPTYSIGISEDGKPYIWGKTQVTGSVDMKADMPEDMGKLEKVSVGTNHALALNEDGEIFAWGVDRQGQTRLTPQVEKLDNIVDIEAGYQFSVIVDGDGNTYGFGNTNNNDYNDSHDYQGNIEKVTANSDGVLGLTKDGKAVYLGRLQTVFSNIPEMEGKVVDIDSTGNTLSAVDDLGNVYVWGNIGRSGLANIPEADEYEGKIISISSGRSHYTALTDKGEILSWGQDYYDQSIIPTEYEKENFVDIHSGYYQNYAITESGNIKTWGLKGYLFGTDDVGRDIGNRLLNGGKMTITIGMISTIISTVIGVIVGGISGFFGGFIDQLLQRLSEMVSSLPSLPLIMLLNAILGNSVTAEQKIKLVMVILGILGWTGLQRLVRSQVLSIREQEYVVAARSVGIKEGTIIFKHIIPNVISVIVVSTTMSFAGNMLTEATLSFLGFGVQPPQPTWGNMLYGANNSVVIQNYWWRWVFTSIILSLCVISINLVGDGLRDAVDPRSQER